MNSVMTSKPVLKPIDHVRQALNLPTMREQLKMALPPQVSLDKFLRVAITAIQQNPKLLEADRNSLYAAIVTCAQLGLLPDAQLGEAYFVPYKGKVQLIPGYRGLLKLARQADVGQVEAEIICLNDDVTYILGDYSEFKIEVSWRDRGEMVGAYAVAKFRDGSIAARTVMMKDEIEQIRARSQMPSGPAWGENYNEMAKKTALRRLSKLLPLNTVAANAFALSELHEEHGRTGNVIEGQLVTDETPPALAMAPEPKRKARKGALDELPPNPQDRPTDRQGGSVNNDRPDLNVDPETGEVIGDFEFPEDHAPPATP